MTTTNDTTEAGETLQEGHTMNGETLYETARSGRYGLEAIRRAEAGDEGDGTPAMGRTFDNVTYVLETGGKLWIVEERGEGAPYQEPVILSAAETARLYRFFLPIALEQLLDWGKEYDEAKAAEQATDLEGLKPKRDE